MRRALTLLVLCVAGLSAAGCGGSPRAAAGTAEPQIDSASCEVSGGAGRQTTRSCTFVVSDGRRFSCNRFFTGPAPSVSELERAADCRRLPSLVFSRAERALMARLSRARNCLVARGLRVSGGPVLPPVGPTSTEPDGELVIGSASLAFIAFYTSAARARRIEPVLRRDDAHAPVLLQRRGAVTIAWIRAPAGEPRNMVWTCLPP